MWPNSSSVLGRRCHEESLEQPRPTYQPSRSAFYYYNFGFTYLPTYLVPPVEHEAAVGRVDEREDVRDGGLHVARLRGGAAAADADGLVRVMDGRWVGQVGRWSRVTAVSLFELCVSVAWLM